MLITPAMFQQPPAIVRTAASMGIARPRFERVMMDQAIVGSSNPPASEPTTANREYSGSTTGATAPTNSNLSCTEQLTEMEDDGTVPAGESCTCPANATTPQCLSAADTSQECQTALTIFDASASAASETCTCQPGESTPSCAENSAICAQALQQQETIYNTCSCATNATSPICESYYQICEGNLSSSEAANPNSSCSCSNPSTTGTPTCVYDYSACAANAAAYEAANPDEVCTCPATGTNSTTYTCQTDYQVCEENIGNYETGSNVCTCTDNSITPTCQTDYAVCQENVSQYENSSTTCQCSQTSTEPYCCTSTTSNVCTTSQQCSEINSCYQGVVSFSCNAHAYLLSVTCINSGNIAEDPAPSTVSSDFCPPNPPPICNYKYGSGVNSSYGSQLATDNGSSFSCNAHAYLLSVTCINSGNIAEDPAPSTVPSDFCPLGPTPTTCNYKYGSGVNSSFGSQTATGNVGQICAPVQTCSPVTTCNPVTTQSCRSD